MSSPPPTLRQLLDAERQAVLATHSTRRIGWPFASLAAYATTHHGEPLLLLSELAEHTRNLRHDPCASLLVQDSTAADDPQAGARVTLLGTVACLPDDDARSVAARNRYIARHPQAARYLMLGDFYLWVLRVEEARFVNGFGDMGWLAGDQLRSALAE